MQKKNACIEESVKIITYTNNKKNFVNKSSYRVTVIGNLAILNFRILFTNLNMCRLPASSTLQYLMCIDADHYVSIYFFLECFSLI